MLNTINLIFIIATGLVFIKDSENNNKQRELINHILVNSSWSKSEKGSSNQHKSNQNKNKLKRHPIVAHCPNFEEGHTKFQKKWRNRSGVYKFTFLNLHIFSYVGSSKDVGPRLKNHYNETPKLNTFFGSFVKLFGWSAFSVSIIEETSNLVERENFYLRRLKPLLNILTSAGIDARLSPVVSEYTKFRISQTLMGSTHTEATKMKMSISKTGTNNPYYGKSLPTATLIAAKQINASPIYVYDAKTNNLVNGKPFASIRDTVKVIPLSYSTLERYVNTGKPFKGYKYYKYKPLIILLVL